MGIGTQHAEGLFYFLNKKWEIDYNKSKISVKVGDKKKDSNLFYICIKKTACIFNQATWQEAWGFCCSMNMKMFSIEKPLTLACMTKLSKSKWKFINKALVSRSIYFTPRLPYVGDWPVGIRHKHWLPRQIRLVWQEVDAAVWWSQLGPGSAQGSSGRLRFCPIFQQQHQWLSTGDWKLRAKVEFYLRSNKTT